MNRYETIFILDSDVPDAEREPLVEKITSLIPQNNGELLLLDDWGNRKLAFPIKKKLHGRYVRLDYCGIGALVDDLERTFRLDHRILKYMTIQLDKDVNPEALKEALKTQEEASQAQTQAAESGKAAEAETEAGENDLEEKIDQPESVNKE